VVDFADVLFIQEILLFVCHPEIHIGIHSCIHILFHHTHFVTSSSGHIFTPASGSVFIQCLKRWSQIRSRLHWSQKRLVRQLGCQNSGIRSANNKNTANQTKPNARWKQR